jgi:hypothetical protein
MKRSFRPLLGAIIVGALVGPPANCAEPEFSLSISVPQDVLKAGSEVRVGIVLKNTAEHEIRVITVAVPENDTGDTIQFRATVLDGRGDPVPFTALGVRRWKDNTGIDGSGMSGTEIVPPLTDCKLGKGYSPNRLPSACAPFCSAAQLDAANRQNGDCGLARAELVVSRMYDLSKPGKYTIHVTRYDYASKTIVKSNPITVTITP